MNKPLYFAAFGLGLAAVCWIGAGYVGTNPLALAMAALIVAFYLMGALELHRMRQATASLSAALADLREAPPALGPWLDRLHPALQNAVRLRIEGERVALPGPAMAPYLTGLLVLLGMVGTFLGMVVTLKGTGLALDTATDLQAIRASLSAPVKGLGLAFGTSVAGVAASAMLGLMSALCRRDRLLAAQWLDSKIATTLRPFSVAHQREESFRLLQQQAQAMPQLVDRLQAMMDRMAQQGEALNTRLLAGHDSLRAGTEAAYAGLAASVDRSLQQSAADSARAAGAAIQPAVEATLAGIAREATSLQHAMADTVQRQLEGLSTRFDATTSAVAGLWTAAVAEQQQAAQRQLDALGGTLDRFAATFEQRSAALVNSVDASHAGLQEALAGQSLAHQQQVCSTLEQVGREITAQAEAQARNTIAEMARLVQAASDAPRAAAEVMAELRQKLSDSMVRDNAVLEERSRIMQTLGTLLDALNHASEEQRRSIDALVSSSAALLDQAGARFGEQMEAQAGTLADVAAQVTGSAVEVASLGEAFGLAVELFSQSNDKLMAQLQRIEGALGQSLARSDEQLAYYVAQAREIVDLSILSQKQIVEDLQQLSSRRAVAMSEA